MPGVPHYNVDMPEPNAIHVLITAFGPFGKYEVNPSWLAVKPLHNTVIYAEVQPQPPPEPSPHHMPPLGPSSRPFPPPPPEPVEPVDDQMHEDPTPIVQQIHFTTLLIPVSYAAVLAITPGLHARPPVLPFPDDPAFAATHLPPNGFDFIFHTGCVGRGPLRIEKNAHKLNYRMKDAEGQYAPIVQLPKEAPQAEPEQDIINIGKPLLPPTPAVPGNELGPPGASGLPRGVIDHEEHLAGERPLVESPEHQPTRGMGKAYESMPDELYTEVDVPRLIHHLKETGIQRVYSSMDAGHFLGDFLYYGSLAEAKRNASKQEKDKPRSTSPPKMTPVLFMHCCPLGQPFETVEVTDAIKKVVLWVCARLSTNT